MGETGTQTGEDRIRVGVVGVGKLGEHHARIYAGMAGVEVAGIVDRDKARAAAVAKKYNVPVAGGIEDLVGVVDAVSIVTPTPSHYEVAKTFLEKNTHCLIEKPITTSIAHADELIETAGQNNLILQVGHIEQFNRAVIEAAKYVTVPKFIEVNRLGPYDPRVSHVGVVLDLMIHDIEIVLALVKSPIERIDAVGAAVFSEFEDIANARIRFSNGCVANISASRISFEKFRKIRIFQADSYISLDYEKQGLKVYQKKGEQVGSLDDIAVTVPEIEWSEPLMMEISHFIDCLRRKRGPKVSGIEGREALKIALEVIHLIGGVQEKR